MNAAAIKKFVEENQRLAAECANLVSQCNKWERECSLYENDREALMEFGNEADERAREAEERAKEAEIRVRELEEESGKALEELQFYKHKCHTRRVIFKIFVFGFLSFWLIVCGFLRIGCCLHFVWAYTL